MAILKTLILLGTFLIVALCPGFANAELWLHVSTLKDGSEFYYNSDSVCLVDVRDQNNFGFMVRTKEIFSESAAAETAATLGDVLPEGAAVVNDIVTMQFNLHNQCKMLDMFYFDENGKLLCHVPPPPENEWRDISDIPSFLRLYRRILRQITDNHDFYRTQKWYDTTDGKFHDP